MPKEARIWFILSLYPHTTNVIIILQYAFVLVRTHHPDTQAYPPYRFWASIGDTVVCHLFTNYASGDPQFTDIRSIHPQLTCILSKGSMYIDFLQGNVGHYPLKQNG